MATKDEALKLALEALEEISSQYMSLTKKGCMALAAIEEALAEQPYPDNFVDALKFDVARRDSEAQQAYEDAFVNGTGVMLGDKRVDPASIYKAPEQEPVALEIVYETIIHWDEGGGKRSRRELARRIVDLYTSPPASKPWAGLTDEQIHKMTVLMGINPEWKAEMEIVRSVVRNLEVKLREKNA